MDGIILINKYTDYTSQDVCAILRKKLNTKKIGHCGTLDPFATGLLVIGVNKGTKALQFIENYSKTYVATLKLGNATDTKDVTGKTIETKDVLEYSIETIKKVLDSFLGDSLQIPPKYSAIKVKGKPLYKYARENIDIAIKPRPINISQIELVNYKNDEIIFSVVCSKGTYIRTLAEDIAIKLHTVGYLKELTRINVGKFKLEDALTVDDNDYKIIPLADAIDYKKIVISGDLLKDVLNGKPINKDYGVKDVLFVDTNNKAIAIYSKFNDIYKCDRGLF